jgi:hypothetical protein
MFTSFWVSVAKRTAYMPLNYPPLPSVHVSLSAGAAVGAEKARRMVLRHVRQTTQQRPHPRRRGSASAVIRLPYHLPLLAVFSRLP